MFAEVSEDDITDLLELKDSKSTKRCITHSLKSFRGFLGEDNEFETFDKPKLNEKLRLFFASLRKTDGNHLKKSTLTNYRFKGCLQGCRCKLFEKNLRSMTKNTFAIKTDSSGREYVHQQIDEYDKNHRDEATPDDTVGEARMYAREGDPLCPVLSFKLYLEKLHPALNDFWQRTKDSFDITDTTWYCKAPMGKNSLAVMMPEISEKAKLSRRYTNHSIRATSITAMDESGIEARHIMRASGHRSEASIRSYSKRLSENKQREMSDSLNSILQTNQSDNINHELQSEHAEGDHNITVTTPEAQPLLGLSAAEIEALFSYETTLEEIPVTPMDITVAPQNVCVSDNQNKENSPHPAVSSNVQLSMNNVQPWWNTHTMNLCPNITNKTDLCKFVSAKFKFVIGHPEHFLNKVIIDIFSNAAWQETSTSIVIDEAHCVEKWGADFRKDYKKLSMLRSTFPNAKVLALTGTATKQTCEAIKKTLHLTNLKIVSTSIVRDNIKLTCKKRPVQNSTGSHGSVFMHFIK
ncbi:unnamed protein product [Mytilus edulis]|uniref:Helicase ATP-binding domain-containing protein n=1 Tax=Mytilus edulis TaxID=6550 RepID=A0A8S3SFV8_MYTED|nr:unnamed protein product [Mytilus edulis]